MKVRNTILGSALLFFLMAGLYAFTPKKSAAQENLNGAWQQTINGNEAVLLFMDGYFTQTIYNKAKKQFIVTRGGTCIVNGNNFTVGLEFDTENKNDIGQSFNGQYTLNGNQITLNFNGQKQVWKRVDNGKAPLAGVWRITHRMQNEQLTAIHQTGPRKTLKILTGNRFQWAAINPETKEFSGTGGGTYTFENGKYTENIEYFSRDSSRVGASLSFDDKLEGGAWHHTGLSSRGEKIYEVWGRVK